MVKANEAYYAKRSHVRQTLDSSKEPPRLPGENPRAANPRRQKLLHGFVTKERGRSK
jgi:hypothetical protein